MNQQAPTVDERVRQVEAELLGEPLLARQAPPTATLVHRLATLSVPGVSVAVLDQGRLAWARAYGVRQAGSAEPVTVDTMFQAASISKSVAAVATMRLVDQGLLELDEDVNHYLRSWKVPANGSWQPRVTIRQILCHSAGLTVHGFPGYRRDRPVPTTLEILDGLPPANTLPVRVNAVPGLQFRYAGGGTTVLQQLLVDRTGQSFPELMHELVFAPLGMRNSTYDQPLPAERWPQAAAGHRTGGDMIEGGWHVYPEMAAAGLWTTPSDLALLVLDLQAALAGAPSKLLRRPGVEQMVTRQVENRYGWTAWVGLGFFLDGEGASLRFSHGGDNEGFKALLVAYATGGRGAVVMTNGDGGWMLNDEIVRTVARAYNWPDYTPLRREPVALDSAVLEPYIGTYEIKPGQHVMVTAAGDRLLLQFSDQPPVELQALSTTGFVADVVNLELEVTPVPGAVPELHLRQNGAEMIARKIP